jgi:hypothetical protein
MDVPVGWWKQEIYSKFGVKATERASVLNSERLMDNIQIDMEQ